jgi:CDP-diacylglycerol--glycerol-3-phosphate 3-phosphatidyltransferase
MSALREWAATLGPEARGAVAVSSWGKWKTACQVWPRARELKTSGGSSQPLLIHKQRVDAIQVL